MSKALFESMTQKAREIMETIWRLRACDVVLVSGGAAWADHVAVRLFLDSVCDETRTPYAGLHIHLPCAWDSERNRAAERTGLKWTENPGRLMNQLHRDFAAAMGTKTLTDISTAKALGADLTISDGFHSRNRLVARSDCVIAFTWGTSKNTPKDGGTAHTWSLARTRYKIHVPLNTLSTSGTSPSASDPSTTPWTLSKTAS